MSPVYQFNIRSKGQRSQGHKVLKHFSVEGDRVAGVSLHSSSALPLVLIKSHSQMRRQIAIGMKIRYIPPTLLWRSQKQYNTET